MQKSPAAAPDPLAKALLDVTSDAVLVLDEAGRCVQASRQTRAMLGYAEADLSRLRAADLLDGGADLDDLTRAAQSLREGQSVTRRVALRHRAGHALPAEITMRCVRGEGPPFFLAIVRAEPPAPAEMRAVPPAPADTRAVPPAPADAARGVGKQAGPSPADRSPVSQEGAAPPAHFAVAMSHELRTPLTTILGTAELLLRAWRRLDDATRRQGLERLLSAARRLDLLVRDLLLVTGAEQGNLAVHPAPTPLAPLLEQALYDASAAHPNLDVRARGLRRAPLVYADPDRVVQVMVHLLDNAARHGRGAGPPEVRVETHAHVVTVRVSDRGPGIPREGRERLFTRFGKLSQASHAGRVGTGLGLYICRQLVERMGGTIGVTSTPGKGASFWFTLPLADQGAPGEN